KIRRQETSKRISKYEENEQLVFSSHKGIRLLSLEPVLQKKQNTTEATASSNKNIIYNTDDIIAISQIFDHLAPIHIDRGDTLATLVRVAGEAVGEKRVRQIVRKLSKIKVKDPHIANLAGSSGAAKDVLYDLFVRESRKGVRQDYLKPQSKSKSTLVSKREV